MTPAWWRAWTAAGCGRRVTSPRGLASPTSASTTPGHAVTRSSPDARGEALDRTPRGAPTGRPRIHASVPQVVFTDPQVASVGLTAAEAADRQTAVRVVDLDLSDVAGTSLQGSGPAGRARMIVDTDREVVLGMTLVGQDVGELLARGDHRHRRRGSAAPALARRPVLPHRQRALAAAARGVRLLATRPCRRPVEARRRGQPSRTPRPGAESHEAGRLVRTRIR